MIDKMMNWTAPLGWNSQLWGLYEWSKCHWWWWRC